MDFYLTGISIVNYTNVTSQCNSLLQNQSNLQVVRLKVNYSEGSLSSSSSSAHHLLILHSLSSGSRWTESGAQMTERRGFILGPRQTLQKNELHFMLTEHLIPHWFTRWPPLMWIAMAFQQPQRRKNPIHPAVAKPKEMVHNTNSISWWLCTIRCLLKEE